MQSLLALSLACRSTHYLYHNDTSSRVYLDGNQQMDAFYERLSSSLIKRPCPEQESDATSPSVDHRSMPPSKKLKREQVRHLNLHDIRYDHHCTSLQPSGSAFPAMVAMRKEVLSIERLNNTLSVCPNLETLHIRQSAIPLGSAAAVSIVASCPKLKALTVRSPNCDTSTLAGMLCSLQELRMLEVSSVKTCSCRGKAGQVHAAIELGLALRTHSSLRRVVFNSCKVLNADDGILLRVLGEEDQHMCPHKEAVLQRLLRQQWQRQDMKQSPHGPAWASLPQHGHRKSSTSIPTPLTPASKVGPPARLESIEFRRSPLHGRALLRYLRSAPAASLNHLFVGGCKQVRPGHLILATQDDCTQRGLVRSSKPLHLEIDGRLLSKEMLRALSHRIAVLRIFEPSEQQLRLVMHVINTGGLYRLTDLVVLPLEDDLPRWAPLSKETLRCSGLAGGGIESGDLRSLLEDQLTLVAHRQRIDLTVGDEAWHGMLQCREALRFWARVEMEEKQAESERAFGSSVQDDDDDKLDDDWSGSSGLDVWR